MTGTEPEVGLRAFQDRIEALYLARDRQRGIDGTFTWFVEEVGELAKELRRRPRDPQRLQEEMGDVLAWLVTLASLLEPRQRAVGGSGARIAHRGPARHGTRPVAPASGRIAGKLLMGNGGGVLPHAAMVPVGGNAGSDTDPRATDDGKSWIIRQEALQAAGVGLQFGHGGSIRGVGSGR